MKKIEKEKSECETLIDLYFSRSQCSANICGGMRFMYTELKKKYMVDVSETEKLVFEDIDTVCGECDNEYSGNLYQTGNDIVGDECPNCNIEEEESEKIERIIVGEDVDKVIPSIININKD